MKICEVCGARFRGNPTVCPLDGGELKDLPDPLIGRTIAGRYVIRDRIGAGGMGTVYRAHQEVLGRDVAIKFLAQELAFQPTSKTRFLREARAANRINHEHIIDITDYGETDDGLVYLVMEFLDGVPLNEEIAKGPMYLPRAVTIAWQMAAALGRAHELDVIHRDIKPDNVYLLRGHDGDFVKILDFGLAHMKGEIRVTATGAIFGTPEYMSPEQARGAPVGPAADLYALGCVLYEMLTGELPFRGSTPDLILQHLREPATPPSQVVATVPTARDALVLRLLAKSPDERPRSAFEVAEALRAVREANRRSVVVGEDSTVHQVTMIDSTEHTLPDASDEHPSHGSLVDRWTARLETFQSLVRRAHPAGPAPVWLEEALGELADQVSSLEHLTQDLHERASAASSEEDHARSLRMNIGRALDALTADEARVLHELAGVEARVEAATRRVREAEAPLREGLEALEGRERHRLDDEAVTLLRGQGNGATLVVAAREGLREAAQAARSHRAALAGLHGQRDVFHGPIGGLSAASEVDLDGLREETKVLDRRVQRRLDEVVKRAEPIVRHFMMFPHLRDAVRRTHAQGA